MTRKNPSDSNTSPSTESTSQAGGPKSASNKNGWRTLARVVLVISSVLALLAGSFFYLIHTERGTRFAWQAARILTARHLSGTLEGGTLRTGVQLRDVRWHTTEADIRLDHVQGQWALSRKPWRLVIDFLHVGTVDLAFTSAKKQTQASLPQRLTLPLQLQIRDLRVQQIRLHQSNSTAEYNQLNLQVHSDGRHHELNLKQLETPFGATHAQLQLDGVRPFVLSGRAHLDTQSTQEQNETASFDLRLSGSLEALIAELTASGKKLTGHAHIEALPFAQVPLKAVNLKIEHLNPQVFHTNAPAADLLLQAQLQPAQDQQPTSTAASATHTTEITSLDQMAVAGTVTIVNKKPGPLDAHLLPLLEARAKVRLSAPRQIFTELHAKFLEDFVLTGNGTFMQGRGQLDLQVDKFDLSRFNQTLRKTQLSGPVNVSLTPETQHAELKLIDSRLAMRVQAALQAEATQTRVESTLQINTGQAKLSGELNKDKASTYKFNAKLDRFNPLTLFNQSLLNRKISPARVHNKQINLQTSLSGTLQAEGKLAQQSVKATYALHDSSYAGMPLTGAGTLQLAKKRLLPSHAELSIAGNQLAIDGSFGRAKDQLVFHLKAPQLARLGFKLAGSVQADGDISGTFSHPHVSARYQASALNLGAYRLGYARGQAELGDGASGALNINVQASDLITPELSLQALKLQLAGTRAKHSFSADILGQARNLPIDLSVSARGSLFDKGENSRWEGTLSQFVSRKLPTMQLATPVAISAATQQLKIGAAHLTIENAALNLCKLIYDHGRIDSSGALSHLDANRLLQVAQLVTDTSPVTTNLIFDSDWDIALDKKAVGYLQLKRRTGDITLLKKHGGSAALGITQLATRVDFSEGQFANLTAHAQVARLGNLEASLRLPLRLTDESIDIKNTFADSTPISGKITATVPSLKTTSGLLDPQIVLEGQAALDLSVAGRLGKPTFSGLLKGDNLALTLLNEGATLTHGIARIALSDNAINFQQVEFHGASGIVRATGGIQLDQQNPDLSALIVAQKLELFATPERQLTFSGQASLKHAANSNQLKIDGQFIVDHALLDLPATASPELGDDVKIVHADNEVQRKLSKAAAKKEQSADQLLPNANIWIDLGRDFRFRGAGADLKLRGKFQVISVPPSPLRAIGDVKAIEGSTYETFGRKLNIEKGYFTFNGPINNPGINILAMRRKQAVEAGVEVTGTVRSPQARLISEPNYPDEEKLSWLLFGHGTNSGVNIGQQNTMNAAFALLGSAGGKKIAQTIGFDEFSIGQSETGLTDSQVVNVAKAWNEHLILGYEQALTTAASLFKITWQISRSWSVAAHTGTLNGVDLIFQRRFNRLFKKSKKSKEAVAD